MNTSWQYIDNVQKLTVGMFIMVEYQENGYTKRNNSLNKVIKANKNSFTLQEIGTSGKDFSQKEILNRFPMFNSEKRTQITKDGKYISLQPLPPREILAIFKINPAILKKIILKGIGEEVISKKENKIIEIKEGLEARKEELKLLKKKKKKAEARIKKLGI